MYQKFIDKINKKACKRAAKSVKNTVYKAKKDWPLYILANIDQVRHKYGTTKFHYNNVPKDFTGYCEDENEEYVSEDFENFLLEDVSDDISLEISAWNKYCELRRRRLALEYLRTDNTIRLRTESVLFDEVYDKYFSNEEMYDPYENENNIKKNLWNNHTYDCKTKEQEEEDEYDLIQELEFEYLSTLPDDINIHD